MTNEFGKRLFKFLTDGDPCQGYEVFCSSLLARCVQLLRKIKFANTFFEEYCFKLVFAFSLFFSPSLFVAVDWRLKL